MSDKPAKEKTEKVTVPSVTGMVVYTDGGARPNPGYGGFGIHGYLFDTATPIKGIGLGPEMASNFGYAPSKELMAFDKAPELNTPEKILNVMDKSDKSWSVMPTSFIDVYGSLATMVTNNACEIIGVNTALQFAIDHQVKYIQIRTDSKLTRDAANEWVHGWAKNGWVTREGAPVKNLELVKSLKRNLDTLADTGSVVKIDWIRAHNGDTGNEAADKLATMGVFSSRSGVEKTDIKVSPAQGYWKNDADKHPFIAHKRMYFNTLAGSATPGVYFLGDTGKDDEQFGKKMSDGTFSVVRLETPEPLLEQIRSIQSKYSNYADSLFKVYVDQLYSPGVFKLLNCYGEISIEPPSGYRLDLTHVTGAPLTREYKPARLAWRAVDALTGMSTWLDEFLAGDPKIVSTNITSVIFDITQKVVKGKKGEEDKVETEYKLRPELVVGLSSLKVDINHPLGKDEKIELALAVGIDILERNALKRLEDLSPEIHVITWVEGTGVYRYATVAKAGGSVGIWAGVYSNIRMIT